MHRRELVHFSKNLLHLRLNRPAGRTLAAARLAAAILVAFSATIGLAAGPDDPVVSRLLDAAEAAEREDHLIYPASGSAMSLYHEILYMEPDNVDAIAGLTRLAEIHLEQAQVALDQGQLLKADSMVSKARMIYPDYPAIDTLHHQIALFENAERTRETLDWRLVAERSGSLTPQLNRLGSIAKQGDCRVTINVSNDAEGRWVFKQLNSAAGDNRVRAEVKISSPAAVDILCFPAEPPTG